MAEPKVFTIAPGVAFADALAGQVLAQHGADPLGLARVRILLPNRRACRSLSLAFLRLSRRPALLPRIQPLGDVDEDELTIDYADVLAEDGCFTIPPAISPLRRHLLLSRLILALRGEFTLPDQAARLARDLAKLIDQVHTENCAWTDLERLVPDEFAAHWQITLRFLALVTEHWPQVLADEGCIDPADRRNRLLMAQAEAWTKSPPTTPVIAAGSTGSIPATAELLRVVAGLPAGAVVLPGLDPETDAETWERIRNEPWHPQHGMARLLVHLQVAPPEVMPWPCPPRLNTTPTSRARLLSEAFLPVGSRPPAIEATWVRELLDSVHVVETPGPAEEARVIALLLRHTLEIPGQTAALVTTDRTLGRRVAAELKRWNIEIDDSAGLPLADTPSGAFMRLVARMAAEEFAPVPLLAAMKHRSARCGRPPEAFRNLVRLMEVSILRGPRPLPGLAGLAKAAEANGQPGVCDLVEDIRLATSGFVEALSHQEAPFRHVLAGHIAAAEALARDGSDPESGPLWQGEQGEALAEFLRLLLDASEDVTFGHPRGYPALFDSLIAEYVVRPNWGSHPRLAVWGPIEARLQRADVMILGSFNEDSWPAASRANPWMSRPMMRSFGLPSPERRLGLSAHDFAQAFSAPSVWITRARTIDGVPTIASRWLTRIEILLRAAAVDQALRSGAQWFAWQALLDQPTRDERRRALPPRPCPPVMARPRRLSVTRIETWMRDPYAIYAEFILGLRALDPIDAEPGAADFGNFVHQALEAFAQRLCRQTGEDPLPLLLECGREAIAPFSHRSGISALWWPRFKRIAVWLTRAENFRDGGVTSSFSEVKGTLLINAPAGFFELTATADRIDQWRDGSLTIIDYKTGALPRLQDVSQGFSPQLPLEAAIASFAGFPDVQPGNPAAIEYWKLDGRRQGGERRSVDPDGTSVAAMAQHALGGLVRLIVEFDRPETAYESCPRQSVSPRYNHYAHLAREKEWAVQAPLED